MSEIDYDSVKEVAEKWQVSQRSVRNYCSQGRVEGALLEGKNWKNHSGNAGTVTLTKLFYLFSDGKRKPV